MTEPRCCPEHPDVELVPDPYVWPGTEWIGAWWVCLGVFPLDGRPWCSHSELDTTAEFEHAVAWD